MPNKNSDVFYDIRSIVNEITNGRGIVLKDTHHLEVGIVRMV